MVKLFKLNNDKIKIFHLEVQTAREAGDRGFQMSLNKLYNAMGWRWHWESLVFQLRWILCGGWLLQRGHCPDWNILLNWGLSCPGAHWAKNRVSMGRWTGLACQIFLNTVHQAELFSFPVLLRPAAVVDWAVSFVKQGVGVCDLFKGRPDSFIFVLFQRVEVHAHVSSKQNLRRMLQTISNDSKNRKS